MSEVYTVTLEVKVTDKHALWVDAAGVYQTEAGIHADLSILGSEAEPDVGACLQMLLDRNEMLDGAEIQESSAEAIPSFLKEAGADDETCRECGAVEGTPEYGTVGDGFNGLCPSCADKADAAEEQMMEDRERG